MSFVFTFPIDGDDPPASSVVHHVTEVQAVFGGEIVIDSHATLIEVILLGDGRSKDVRPRVGQRKEMQKTSRKRTEEWRGEHVEGKRRRRWAGQKEELVIRIAAHAASVEGFLMVWIAQLRKISLPLFHRRHS